MGDREGMMNQLEKRGFNMKVCIDACLEILVEYG